MYCLKLYPKHVTIMEVYAATGSLGLAEDISTKLRTKAGCDLITLYTVHSHFGSHLVYVYNFPPSGKVN